MQNIDLFYLPVLTSSVFRSLPAFPFLAKEVVVGREAFMLAELVERLLCYLAGPRPTLDNYREAASLTWC